MRQPSGERPWLWFWGGFLLVGGMAWAMEVRAQTCDGTWEGTQYVYWTLTTCGANSQTIGACSGPDPTRVATESLKATAKARYPSTWQHTNQIYGTCTRTHFSQDPDPVHPGAGSYQWVANYSCQGTSSINFTAPITYSWFYDNTGDPPPWWVECAPYEGCPTTNTAFAPKILPAGSSGAACMKHGPNPTDGCSVTVAFQAGFYDGTTNWGRYNIYATGASCVSGEGDENVVSKDQANNVTCVPISGQVHCWHKDEPDCQYVNGERWCMEDVALQPIITAQGQVLEPAGANTVVDSGGTPVAPDSKVQGAEAVGTQEINHYTSTTVTTNHYGGGGAGYSGNPAQSGSGVPGAGSSGDGGPGDGSCVGDGCSSDGDPFSGPEVGEGDDFGATTQAMETGWSGFGDSVTGVVMPAGGIPTGTGVACPIISFTAWGEQIVGDMHCAIIDEHKTYLQLVFLLIYGLASARIVLSA